MRWKNVAGKLLLYAAIVGLAASEGRLRLPLIPDCASADFSGYPAAKEPPAELFLEQELLAITNRDRLEQGLPPLVLDEKLMQVAREHSLGMAQQGFISHDQPSGNLQIRLSRAGYSYEAARENVASARTVAKAHAALLNSPRHKENILAADVTRVGIGIARYPSLCDKYIYITEVFAAPREIYEPFMVRDLLENKISALRQQSAGTMAPDPRLDRMASASLDSLSVPYNREELKGLLASSANELQQGGETELSRLEVIVQLLRNPKSLNIPASTHLAQARMYGTAVRQITDSRNQPAFLVLTLIGVAR